MELKIEHLSKRFKDKTAVDDVSLTLTSGVWGLLGANGAGKTTLNIVTPCPQLCGRHTGGLHHPLSFAIWQRNAAALLIIIKL